MKRSKPLVSEQRRYGVLTVMDARAVVRQWIEGLELEKAITFGLPEVDDRYHVWRVPLLNCASKDRVGECVIDARTSLILEEESTSSRVLEAKLLGRNERGNEKKLKEKGVYPQISTIKNTVAQGDAEEVLQDLPAQAIDLVFTSPPYFNARPEYQEYLSYEEYLLKMRRLIHQVHAVLSEGRFFVMNISPVLLRRASRSQSSRRLAVPFDFHRLFIEEGFDFVDDIHWVKPEGAGWATGRGRRFSADRNPLQYKPVPVTEYILVYRKKTERLIDWNIRFHPDQEAVKRSKIHDPYEVTNIWRIKPAHSKRHPAIFPLELAEKVLRYYSFENDVVLDPFAGIGTVGRAAAKLGRRFVLIEKEAKYIDHIRQECPKWLGKRAGDVLFLNCGPADTTGVLF